MVEVEVSIIIVSWNVSSLLKHCLKSLQDNSRLQSEIIVIDNASRDGTSEMVKRNFPKVKLIENKKNFGFAYAVNQGISLTRGKYILLLNPDTVILPRSIELAVKYLASRPEAGILGGEILNPDLSRQPSCRRFPDFLSQALILLKLHHFFPHLPVFKKYFAEDFSYLETAEVDQVMGAFFLIKREVIEKIGPFDENFFLWFEEVDFCRRAKKMGYKVIFYPKAKIIHHGAESFKQVLALRSQIYFNKSLLYYFKKHHSKTEYYLLFPLIPLSYLMAFIVQILRFFHFRI